MAFVLVFCVPCALMSIVLTPPIFVPDYWLICPTCVYLNYPPHLLLYNLLVFAVPCQFVINVTIACILSCPVCLVVPCPALPSLQLSCFSPTGVVFVACFVLFLINKAHSPYTTESSPHPLYPTLTKRPYIIKNLFKETCVKKFSIWH